MDFITLLMILVIVIIIYWDHASKFLAVLGAIILLIGIFLVGVFLTLVGIITILLEDIYDRVSDWKYIKRK